MSSPAAPLSARVDGSPDAPVIHLDGELDLAGDPILQPIGQQAATEGWSHAVLELGGLTFVDSSGLRALLDLARALAGAGCTVETHAPHGSEARLLIELTRTQAMLGLEG